MSNTFAPDIVGPLYWWMGQVVDDDNWYPNTNPKIQNRDDKPGWGFRYKVRIFGRDVKTKEGVSDDQLDWVELVLPVTAGSGHAGSVQTPNIRQGAYVIGFYKDGISATQPVIFGVLPNHSETRLFGGDPRQNFIPRSGYKGSEKSVATPNIYANPTGSGTPFIETPDQHQSSVAHKDQQKDGARLHYIPKTKACDGPSGEIKGIQRSIKNLLASINRVKAETNSFVAAASDITNEISSIVNDAAAFISSLMKSLLGKMRGYIVNNLNNGIKDLVEKLPPNQRPGFNETNETATDALQCVFNKIIRGLVDLVKKLLEDIIDKYINAPMCAVENFVGSILSSVLGDITSGIQNVLSVIQGITGNIIGQIFGALDVVIGVLNFLSCDESLDCSMEEEWSFWGGAKSATENVRSGIGSFFQGVLSGVGATDTPPCNTSAIPCGPPTVSITGGGGSGALGNPIISATGAILGIDFINGGSGYTSSPEINIIDNCGIGGGSVIVPIMNDGSVSGSIVLDSGSGYLSAPNGDLGGNGTVWATKDQTVVQRSDGTYDTPYNPGSVINLNPGDIIQYPGQSPVGINTSDSVTAPTYTETESQRGSEPSTSAGTYPVVLGICSVFIANSGVAYLPTDKITVTPDRGTVLEPKYDSQGRLIDVNVIECGIGFTDFPTITIGSTQGFNAQIVPIFNVIRVGDLPESQDVVPPGTSIISVIDCVGRFK